MALVNPTRDAGVEFIGAGGRVGQRVRVPKTAELVAAHLRRQIVRNELHEGDALPPEAVLMAQFGVSRPTLREAFRVLEAEGLISVRRGAHGGARVHTPDVDVAARYAGLVLEHRGATLGYATRQLHRDVFRTRIQDDRRNFKRRRELYRRDLERTGDQDRGLSRLGRRNLKRRRFKIRDELQSRDIK